jgi:ParB family transcriptional regulator, chromosome partitioning protein
MSKRPILAKMRGVDELITMDLATQSAKKTANLMPLTEIIDRSVDTRPLNLAHVESLTESIAAIGLIQPIAVDSQGRLLAGGHRRAAIANLHQTNPAAFAQYFSGGIPIRRYDFDASQDADLALAIEASENEKRRDYTPAEVRDLADRLKAAGYHHTRGRAKTGDKPLLPSLATIVGKSERQIKRYLADEPVEKLNGPCVPFSQKYLKQAISSLQQYLDAELATPAERELLEELPSLIERLEMAVLQ